MSKRRSLVKLSEQQTYFTVASILCPTVFNKSSCPFGVSKTDSFTVYVCYNYVFFYGYLPLAAKYLIINAKPTAVFFLWVSSPPTLQFYDNRFKILCQSVFQLFVTYNNFEFLCLVNIDNAFCYLTSKTQKTDKQNAKK